MKNLAPTIIMGDNTTYSIIRLYRTYDEIYSIVEREEGFPTISIYTTIKEKEQLIDELVTSLQSPSNIEVVLPTNFHEQLKTEPIYPLLQRLLIYKQYPDNPKLDTDPNFIRCDICGLYVHRESDFQELILNGDEIEFVSCSKKCTKRYVYKW